MSFKLSSIPYLRIACLIGAVTLVPNLVQGQDARVKTAMELLESKANKLGPAMTKGTDAVAGKQVLAMFFGSTKMNNNFDLVDEVVKEAQGTATMFVKKGNEYVCGAS